jgi:hypothetical protein
MHRRRQPPGVPAVELSGLNQTRAHASPGARATRGGAWTSREHHPAMRAPGCELPTSSDHRHVVRARRWTLLITLPTCGCRVAYRICRRLVPHEQLS